jgi:hypothetical protein
MVGVQRLASAAMWPLFPRLYKAYDGLLVDLLPCGSVVGGGD